MDQIRRTVHEYVECLGCDFVYMAENVTTPSPKGQSTCPNCDGDRFQFTDQ